MEPGGCAVQGVHARENFRVISRRSKLDSECRLRDSKAAAVRDSVIPHDRRRRELQRLDRNRQGHAERRRPEHLLACGVGWRGAVLKTQKETQRAGAGNEEICPGTRPKCSLLNFEFRIAVHISAEFEYRGAVQNPRLCSRPRLLPPDADFAEQLS